MEAKKIQPKKPDFLRRSKMHPLLQKPVRQQKDSMENLFRYKKPEPEPLMFCNDEKDERLRRLINALIDECLVGDTCIIQGA